MNGNFRQWAMGPCFYCGKETYRCAPKHEHPQKYTRDHLVPKPLRGKVAGELTVHLRSHWLTVVCCWRCNQKKGCMSPEAFLRKFGVVTDAKIQAIHRAFSIYRNPPNEAAKSLAAELQ